MKSIIQVAVVGSALACHALPEVVNVKVEPVSPWGKAYITFGINEDFETNDTTVAIMAHLVASNRQTHVIYEHVCKMDSLKRENNHVLWDMKGRKRYFPMSELDFKVKLETWVRLLASGPYWAECNVGAQTPEDAGYSFWWGDIIGYRQNNEGKWVASDRSTEDFEFSATNAKTYDKDITLLKAVGYIDGTGTDCLLRSEFDAASAHLGGGCRMPTRSEIESLSGRSTQWTMQNGCWGYKVKGAGVCSSNSIFLPVTSDETGMYWSSQIGYRQAIGSAATSTDSRLGIALSFDHSAIGLGMEPPISGDRYYSFLRFRACSVRAVVDFLK